MRYALVLFEAFTATAVLMFPPDLTAIGAAMGKRHPDQGGTLQFTAGAGGAGTTRIGTADRGRRRLG